MTHASAIETVNQYAANWSVELNALTISKEIHPWWFLYRTHSVYLDFEASTGKGSAGVHHRLGVRYFTLTLNSQTGHMPPMWAAYPSLYPWSVDWRYGDGNPAELYKYRWHAWYRALTREQQLEYQARFPPYEESGWDEFYTFVADVRAKPDCLGDWISGRVR